MRDGRIGSYHEERFPPERTPTMDVVRLGRQMHHVPILLEVDVTAARAALARRKREGGEDLSFTGWAIKCLAQAVSEHKRVQARRRGRRKLVLFEDVDVSVAAYRRVTGEESQERVPMPFVIRRASEKTLEEIDREIRAAQVQPLADGQQVLETGSKATPGWLMHAFFAAPFLVRRWLVWDRLLGDPLRAKREMGTVMVTSVPATGTGSAWAIPAGIHPLMVALGSVARKPGVASAPRGTAAAAPAAAPATTAGAGAPAEARIEVREVLSLSVLFDHDVVDGVPVALFLKRLTTLMESAAFL